MPKLDGSILGVPEASSKQSAADRENEAPGNIMPTENNEESFHVHIGESKRRIARLMQENFDLKLTVERLLNLLNPLGNKDDSAANRMSIDSFYNYDDDNQGGDESAKDARRQKEICDMKALCQHDMAKLCAEREEALAHVEEIERREAKTLAEKETALENMLSEILSLKMQVCKLEEEIASGETMASAQDFLTSEIMQLSNQLEVERSEKYDLAQKLSKFEENLLPASRTNNGQATGLAKTIIAEQAAVIRKLELQLSSEASIRALERQASVQKYADLPTGLAEPDFELYEQLTNKVDGTAGKPRSSSKPWRESVLNELDNNLLQLYTMAKRLEQDRTTFVEKYCRPLVERQRYDALEAEQATDNTS